jgi:exoribonuclease R
MHQTCPRYAQANLSFRATGGAGAEVAIYIRQVGIQSQFYSMSGKWIHRRQAGAKFFVPNFVEAQELDPLIPYLPDSEVLPALQDKLQILEHALPRGVGSSLVKKMMNFWRESDAIYREASQQLDTAHRLVAQEYGFSYFTLDELARKILPTYLQQDGAYPTAALYALHRRIAQITEEDGGFLYRYQSAYHRTWGEFEILPMDEVSNFHFVVKVVRNYQESLTSAGKRGRVETSHVFRDFIKKATSIITTSRSFRGYTPYGALGPLQGADRVLDRGPVGRKGMLLSPSQERFIRFMRSWAQYRTIPPTNPLSGVGATILRATGMYPDVELDRTIGWTFLQEIGAVPPWENPVQSQLRLTLPVSDEVSYTGQPDTMSGLRRDWGRLPVYCIDSASTQDIDDGISVEQTEIPGQTWVHVHVADPASGLAPWSSLAHRAEQAASSIYFPEQTIPMLPVSLQNEFSLAPGSRSLTFSALLNEAGDIVKHQVTAGTIQNVLYMTPGTVAAVLGGESHANRDEGLKLGRDVPHSPSKTGRNLLEPATMHEIHRTNLQLLHKVAVRRTSHRAAKGAIDTPTSSFKVSVDLSMCGERVGNDPHDLHNYNADPSIEVKFKALGMDISRSRRTDLVEECMLLAGEVAARWCHERGIPIIHRVTQAGLNKADPRQFFDTTIRPLLKASSGTNPHSDVAKLLEVVPPKIFDDYRDLVEAVLPSATPGPHIRSGLDMFARATSPLRRYSDLVTHWQIEAALREEAKTGRSLAGRSTHDDLPLPFSKADLDELIPRLSVRERAIHHGQWGSERFWTMLLLFRAWRFGEAQLPTTFRFIVSRVESSVVADGVVEELGGLQVSMVMNSSSMGKLSVEDVREGDIFEVKIQEVNPYRRKIIFDPVRKLKEKAPYTDREKVMIRSIMAWLESASHRKDSASVG